MARRGDTVIVETRHGFVMAAAGVDASNTAPGTVLLLPEDPDGSARRIRAGSGSGSAARSGWSSPTPSAGRGGTGSTDVAIGVAGVRPLDDLRGRTDGYGNELTATVTALADELAAAGELVKGKLAGVPVAVVRGLAHLVTARGRSGRAGPGAPAPPRTCSGRHRPTSSSPAARSASSPTSRWTRPRYGGPWRPPSRRPAPHHTTPWRFVLLETAGVPDRGCSTRCGRPGSRTCAATGCRRRRSRAGSSGATCCARRPIWSCPAW